MGTVIDKLDYLTDSINIIKEGLSKIGINTEGMTLREIANIFNNNILELLNFINNYTDIIETWVAFENGQILNKKTNESLTSKFTYNEETKTYKLTDTLSPFGPINNYLNFDLLVFNQNQLSDFSNNNVFAISVNMYLSTLVNNSYPPLCTDIYRNGYFSYWHVKRDDTAILEAYTNDGHNISNKGFVTGRQVFRLEISNLYLEGANYITFTRELSKEEIKLFRFIFDMYNPLSQEGELIAEDNNTPINSNSIGGCCSEIRFFDDDKDYWYFMTPLSEKSISKYSLINYTGEQNLLSIDDTAQYEDVFITNLNEDFYEVGDILPIRSYPIPFVAGDKYLPKYVSGNSDMVEIIGDSIFCKKPGEVAITCYAGNQSDTKVITIKEPEVIIRKPFYVSKYIFSDDYEKNQDIIFETIQSAYEQGYNQIIFPKIDINVIVHYGENLATPNTRGEKSGYRVPKDMRIDFPRGSRLIFHKGEACKSNNGVTAGGGYSFFCLSNNNHAEINVDYFIGERNDFRQADGTYTDSSKDYSEQCCFIRECSYVDGVEGYENNSDMGLYCGRNYRCKININRSKDVIGFYISLGGGWNFWRLRNIVPKNTEWNGKIWDGIQLGRIDYTDMEHGKIDENGILTSSEEWIRTKDFIDISIKPDIFDNFYIGTYGGYSQGHSARLNRILWYDENNNLLSSEVLATFEAGKRPEQGVKFKISIPTPDLPTKNTNIADDACWIRLNVATDDLFWKIRIGSNKTNESGVLSVTGSTKGLLVYDSDILSTGKLNGWSLDWEDGWYLMQDSVVLNSYASRLTNHSNNMTIFNSSLGSVIMSSYQSRLTIIDSYILSAFNPAEEKEVLTLLRTRIHSSSQTSLDNNVCHSLQLQDELHPIFTQNINQYKIICIY